MSTEYYVLTRNPEQPVRSLYASISEDDETVIQVFLDKEAAESYNVYLEALGTELQVAQIDNIDIIIAVCDVKEYGYNFIGKTEVVIPRAETLQYDLLNTLETDD